MKVYIILALLVGFSFADGACQVFKCGSVTGTNCVAQTTSPADVLVQTCSSGNECKTPADLLSTVGIAAVQAMITAAPISCGVPTPIPYTNNGISGDRCSKDTDCKGNGFTCKNNACRNALAIKDFACTKNADCDVGFYCAGAAPTQKCAAVLAPGAACTPTVPAGFDPQCGFMSYCLN